MPILTFNGKKPNIHPSCYVASNATIIGDVILGEESSVWPNAVIRGDANKISIGTRTSVQDNCVVHVNRETSTTIGDEVIMGHGAIVHACSVGNHVLIGMGAQILDKASVGDWVIVAAGSVVTEKAVIPSKSLVAGIPAKVIKTLSPQQMEHIKLGAEDYVDLSRRYKMQSLSTRMRSSERLTSSSRAE